MKKKLLLFCLLVLCVLSLGLFGCTETPEGDTPPETPPNTLADITGISFSSQSYTYDGEEKEILISGELPTDVSVEYQNNKGTNANTYNATAVLSGEGYNTLTLQATLTINKATYDMSNAKWNYSSPFTYDGSSRSVQLSGLPNGVTVSSYSGNVKTNAGNYTASATFNYDTTNYNAPSVSPCQWVINKATIQNITINATQKVTESDQKQLPVFNGTLPQGVTVNYYFDDILKNDGVKQNGSYAVKIVISGPNYNELILECDFKIKIDLSSLAQKVTDAFGGTPDPWSFLPSSFAVENKTIENIPDFSSFVNVSNIPTNGIGKQLSVVYNTLNKTSKALTFVQPVYDVMGTIKNLYTEFLDSDPEDYQNYTNTVAGITFTIALSETQYLLSAMVKGVSVIIYADLEESVYGAKVQLTSTTILKYTVGEDCLTMAYNVLDTLAIMIDFVRNDDVVLGYMYEYTGIGNASIKTSALIQIDDTYTTLIGTKGDFIPTAISRNCEVYLNSTGKLVGTEVREELDVKALGLATYNTLWYNLNTLSGISNIKKEDTACGLNADTIYINNATEHIHTKTVSTLPTSKKAYSRRFDLEFKKMYFYTYDSANEEYTEVSVEIPMLFIQEEQFSTFEEDFYEKNQDFINASSVTLSVESKDAEAVNYGYYTLLETYDTLMDLVSLDTIHDYVNN